MQVMTQRIGLLALVVLLGLAGCGFHLKGYQQVGPDLDGLFIEQAEQRGGLADEIRQQLLVSGVQLATSAAQANNVLRILQERFRQRVISVDANGKVLEYELLLQASFSLTRTAVQEPPMPQDLELTRQLTFSGSDELSMRSEAQMMRNDMRIDMAGQVIRQLQAQLK
ncbi:MAG: LPS assembly lipoprotein LptE [Chromatiales bacterium]|jgi:LPS-assembly lipoprotein